MIRQQFRKIRPLVEEKAEPENHVKKERKKRTYVRKPIEIMPDGYIEKEFVIFTPTYIKVGKTACEKTDRLYTYKHIEYDNEGWADADKFHPIDFDLLYLKLEGVIGTIRGWCCGHVWDGLKYNGEKVLKWKFIKDG